MSKTPSVLILSGIDPTNGAGLGRDILSVRENNCYPLSVPTALTVQNSMEFQSLKAVDIEHIRKSVDLIKNEFSIKTVKTGLVPTDKKWLEGFSQILLTFSVPIVIDTVIKATSDSNSSIDIPKQYLDLITGKNRIITPNLRELTNIYTLAFGSKNSPKIMAGNISKKFGCTVLTTFEGEKSSIFITDNNSTEEIEITLINSHNSYHGTGCTFSSALASFLALEYSLSESVKKAADYTGRKIDNSIKFKEQGQYYPY